MVITFLVREDHFKEGDIFSTMNDPVALALKERLELSPLKGELVAVGEDEVFLVKEGKSYLANYNFERFYTPQPGKFRTLTLKFKEI